MKQFGWLYAFYGLGRSMPVKSMSKDFSLGLLSVLIFMKLPLDFMPKSFLLFNLFPKKVSRRDLVLNILYVSDY